jgi:hypothetical protein
MKAIAILRGDTVRQYICPFRPEEHGAEQPLQNRTG